MYFLSVLKCELCSFTSNSYRGLTGHIVQKHGIAGKDYYDKYLKKHNEGICPICGKPTTYISMHKGYLKHCSTSCSSLDPNVQNKLENTSKIKYGTTVIQIVIHIFLKFTGYRPVTCYKQVAGFFCA